MDEFKLWESLMWRLELTERTRSRKVDFAKEEDRKQLAGSHHGSNAKKWDENLG